jgi:predicted kinase
VVDVIWLNGPFGVGKSTVAAELAKQTGASLFDPEEIGLVLRAVPGVPVGDFQDLHSWRRAVPACLSGLLIDVESTVVMPMTVYRAPIRNEIRSRLAALDVPYTEVVLAASVEEIERRLRVRLGVPGALEWGLGHLAPSLEAFEADGGSFRIDTTNRSCEEIVVTMHAHLDRREPPV